MRRQVKAVTAPIWCILLAGMVHSQAAVAAPQINNLSLRGLQAGGTTTLVIDGAELLPEPRLLLGATPVAAGTVRDGATDARVEIDITLDPATPPGLYQLRLANVNGISNSVPIGVDGLPQLPFAPTIAGLPAALHGSIGGSHVLTTRFPGRAGERLVIDVEARRIGSLLAPVVRLLNERRLQLAWAQGNAAIGGDARIDQVLPADGEYTVELHDALYRGAAPGHFRLKIGVLTYADLAYPLAARRGRAAALRFAGTNLPLDTSVGLDLNGVVGDVPAPWPALTGLTGARPMVIVSDMPEIVEERPADGSTPTFDVPVGINGRLSAAGEDDRYRLAVQPGTTLRFNVLANRAGSPLDGVLTIMNEQGGTLAASDDQAGTIDPGQDFAVPADVSALLVSVKDLLHRGGENYVYRLTAVPTTQPDFTLSLFEERQHAPRAGTAIVRVRANRVNFNGPIKLSLPAMPAGVTIAGDEIPAGATDTLLSLTAAEASPAQVVTTLIGTSGDPNVPLARVAQLPESAVSRSQPWLRGELALAVTGPAPIQVAFASEPGDLTLPLGSMVAIPVNVARAEGTTGPIRLSLLTSQVPPLKAENNQQVPDLPKTLRIDITPTVQPDAASSQLIVQVPADLPEIPYEVAIAAELLGGADGAQVLARTVTPSRRYTTIKPSFKLELAGDPRVDATAGSGPTGKLTGRVVRLVGFEKEVTLSLAGLPVDGFQPTLVVPAGQTDFEFPVAFPFGTPVGDLAGVKLAGSAVTAPGVTQASDNQIDVALRVIAGGPPPALYPLFEDEAGFVAMLTEGDGKADLDPVDRFAGAAALRVTPGQRFRTKLPTLGFEIAENPTDGQFRYLRFAWKKRGGANVVLQLNADGAWGPAAGTAGPQYRYLAGADRADVAALKVSDAIPTEWTVVTRDLFADFGAFRLDGLAFTPFEGEFALFDHVYLARSESDLAGCPAPLPPEQPLALFEDQQEFVDNLNEGGGAIGLFADEKYSGAASVKVTPDQRFRTMYPGLGVKVRQNPGPGEFRYLRFAWRKQGGAQICVQLNHDGVWGPAAGSPAKFRYDAGVGPESYGAALRVDPVLPAGFTVVTRDLFADFGEFTLTGIALSPQDGEFALFDHIYLGRSPRDFELAAPAGGQ